MRFSQIARLVVTALVLVVLAIGATSASAFSLSSSTSTRQAAAPTNLTYTYSATGSQALSRLDVDLPPGMMHDATAPAVCASVTYESDRCPSFSLAGSVNARIVVLGLSVNVPGSIYRVADDPSDGTFEFGIVLRPPLSALRLSKRVFLKGRATISGDGHLRHSITGDLSSVTLLGIPLRSRISQLRLNFAGTNASGNQLYNSTSCASQPLRATATFSDGRTESRTSPYSTTGCALVPLTSKPLIALDDPRPGVLESIAVQLEPGEAAERGQLRDSHVKSIEVDASELGTFDTQIFANVRSCPTELQLQLRCPEDSRVGSFSTSVKWFAPELTGGLYRSAASPTQIVGVLDLPEERVIGFKIDVGGVNQADSKTLKVSIPVQLPLETTKLKIDTPILKIHGKPASCSNRFVRAVLSGHSGGWSVWGDDNYAGEPCPPEVSFADPADEDGDGDGFADDELRAENFQVRYDVADGGDGVDAGRFQCELQDPVTNAKPKKGKIRVINNGSGGIVCDVTEADGPLTVVFSAFSLDGHVTVLKMSYTVDSQAPVIETTAPDKVVYDLPTFDFEFEFTDDTASHPQSKFKAGAEIEMLVGFGTEARIITDRDTGRSKGFARFENVPDGDHEVTVTVEDSTGHVAVLRSEITVDTVAPPATVCPLLPSSVPGCPNQPIVCAAIYPAPAGCPGGPPRLTCPTPGYLNPVPGCAVATIPGSSTTTLP